MGFNLYGGFVVDAPASDQLTEDLIIDAEEYGDAGHSVEQLPELIQQGVCGGGDDPPELCVYEKLRERNIRERDEAMKETMDEIGEAKQEMRDNAPRAMKRVADNEAGGTRKMKKGDSVVEVRRSGVVVKI